MIRSAVRRPVAVAMVYGAVALLGAFAWTNIPVELVPDANFPRLTVSVSWAGASPEAVEGMVTSPVEGTIQGLRDVRSIESTSREGGADIQVEFDRDADMDFVHLDLSERLARQEDELREELEDEGIRLALSPYVPDEFEEEAERPLLTYQFTGPIVLEALRYHVEEVVEPELAQLDGVRHVEIRGATRDRLLKLEVDEEELQAYGLTVDQVQGVIRSLDALEMAEAGAIHRNGMEWTVAVRDRPGSLDEVQQAIVTEADGTPVRVVDLGDLRDTYTEPTALHRIDGSPAISFQVYRDFGTNAVDVAERARDRVDQLQSLNPPGTGMVLLDDQSEDIRAQLTDLQTRALIAAGVIFLVLLVFLKSLRSAGVVFLTIVFSILIALNLIYFAGFSLNLLTLMGLALGFGLIVDNSIVVLENIYRRWQEGSAPREASGEGAREVGLPIVASTLTTLIVFAPFVYFQGELRIYYVPLAIVVALTLTASLFVAFTFIPALADRLLRWTRGRAGGHAPAQAEVGEGGDGGSSPFYIRFYSGLLDLTLKAPWVAVTFAALCLGGAWYLFDNHVQTGMGFFGPDTDETRINITITLPSGMDMNRVDELARSWEARLADIEEVERFETRVQDTQARITVLFPEELQFSPEPLILEERLAGYALTYTGAQVRVVGQGRMFAGGGTASAPSYRINVYGYNYERVGEIAEDLGRRLEGVGRVEEVNTNASGVGRGGSETEYVVDIDRDALSQYGMGVAEFAWELQAFVADAGRPETVLVDGEPLRFVVEARGTEARQVRELEDARMTSPDGESFRAGSVISVSSREVMPEIHRENQEYHRVVAYDFRGPRALGDLYQAQALATSVLPPGYRMERQEGFGWAPQEEEQMWLVLLVSLGLVFMLTAGLFESIRQPFCVLLSVPMALTGVFLMFFFVNATFSREAFIGVIMMGGIVVNNAILLVDRVNQVRRSRGDLSLEEAIVKGTLERVRPILMTALTTVLGLLPLVLFTEHADATIWNALTYALIGGLLASTLFVLTTTPALYLLMERGPAARAARRSAQDPEEAAPPVPPALSGLTARETG